MSSVWITWFNFRKFNSTLKSKYTQTNLNFKVVFFFLFEQSALLSTYIALNGKTATSPKINNSVSWIQLFR